MQERIEQLFLELGERFKEKDIAEPFYSGSVPRHPAIYVAENIHAFYRGIWNPTKVIYLKGAARSSTPTEIHVSGKLVEDVYRFEVSDEIDLKNFGVGVATQDIEKAMDIIDKVESPYKVEARIPYDAQKLEEIILKNIPEDILRNQI